MLLPILFAALSGTPVTLSDSAPSPTYHFADFDGDGLGDAFLVRPDRPGSARLLRNEGAGGFVDVTEALGLSSARTADFVRWADADLDGRLDLFVGRLAGPSELWVQTAQGTFEPAGLRMGLPEDLAAVSAMWRDVDADGAPDLLVSTFDAELLFRNDGQGLFDAYEIELPALEPVTGSGSAALSSDLGGAAPKDSDGARDTAGPTTRPLGEGRRAGTAAGATNLAPRTGLTQAMTGTLEFDDLCSAKIRDASGGVCLQASRTPTLGRLFPLSTQLNVDQATDFVGINTTIPRARLHALNGPLGLNGSMTSNDVLLAEGARGGDRGLQ